MSDVILGALIALISSTIGAIITAIIAFANIKTQLNLRKYELKTDRLIKTREQVLIPLRKVLNIWGECSNRETVLMVQMGEANKKGDKTELRDAIDRWHESGKKSDEARYDLKVLTGQISDLKLLKMVKEVQVAQNEENQKTIEIAVLAHKPESMNIETVTRLNKEKEAIHNNTLNKIVPLNKRIEELLNGEVPE